MRPLGMTSDLVLQNRRNYNLRVGGTSNLQVFEVEPRFPPAYTKNRVLMQPGLSHGCTKIRSMRKPAVLLGLLLN